MLKIRRDDSRVKDDDFDLISERTNEVEVNTHRKKRKVRRRESSVDNLISVKSKPDDSGKHKKNNQMVQTKSSNNSIDRVLNGFSVPQTR